MPSEFTLHARNAQHNVNMGGNNIIFNMMASAPNCSDTDRGRRVGNQEDYRNFLRLAQMHNILHVTGGYPVEPVDIHASIRHLDCIQDYITLTDKAYCIYSLGGERVADAIEMTRIAHGLTHDQMRDRACMFSIINTNSPSTTGHSDDAGSFGPGRDGSACCYHAIHAGRSHGSDHDCWRCDVTKC